jgi:hypothetical protein
MKPKSCSLPTFKPTIVDILWISKVLLTFPDSFSKLDRFFAHEKLSRVNKTFHLFILSSHLMSHYGLDLLFCSKYIFFNVNNFEFEVSVKFQTTSTTFDYFRQKDPNTFPLKTAIVDIKCVTNYN